MMTLSSNWQHLSDIHFLDLLCMIVYNQFKRSGGNHDIYYNPDTKYSIPLKRGHFDEDDLRYIRKEIKQGGR